MASSQWSAWLEGYRQRADARPGRREHRALRGWDAFGISLGSIIGSGWGFAALNAGQVAGPAALLSWALILVVAVVLNSIHAELAGMCPVTGGSTCYPLPAFGALVSTISGWLYFMNAASTVAIEVSAVLTFATPYLPWLTAGSTPALTLYGFLVALGLVLLLLLVNVVGVGFLARVNGGMVVAKLLLLGGSALVLLAVGGHVENLAPRGFFVMGVPALLSAAATSGIMFAMLGSEQTVQFAGETRSASLRHVPGAMIWALVAAFALYLFLQFAFTVAVDPSWVQGGWKNLSKQFPDSQSVVPFATLARSAQLAWLAPVFVLAMVVAPLGTANMYLASAARTTLAVARIQRIRPLALVTDTGVPLLPYLFCFAVACCLLLPFPNWQTLISFTTKATVAGYGIQALTLGALRRQLPGWKRPYRLPWAPVLAPLGFILANEILMFGGWDNNWPLGIAVLAGIVVTVGSRIATRTLSSLDPLRALWLGLYVFVGLVSYLSSKAFGGQPILPFGVDVAAMAAVSAVIYLAAMRFRLPPDRAETHLRELVDLPEGAGGV